VNIAMMAGSFNPVHFGHLEIANRAAPLFDKIHISVGINREKKYMFTLEERVDQINRMVAEYGSEELKKKSTVDSYTGLLIAHAQKINAKFIVRGMRPELDFGNEFMLDGINKRTNPNIQTIFLISSPEFHFVSSTAARELAFERADVSWLIPDFIEKAIHDKSKGN